MVDFLTCTQVSPGYKSLTIEQQRRLDFAVRVFGTELESPVEFEKTWEAEFQERPPDAVQKLIDKCIERTEPDQQQIAESKALGTAGAIFLGLAGMGAALAISGGVLVNQAEKDFKSATTFDARNDANRSGERGQALAITGVATTGVMAPLGAAMLMIRSARRRTSVAFAPSAHPHFAGLSLLAQF